MTLEFANHLQASAGKPRFSDMTTDQLVAVRDEFGAIIDSMEESGASCSPISGFDQIEALHRIVCSLID